MDHHAPLSDGSGSDRLFIKSQIANHPLYPHLLSAFLDCHKVGADPDRISFLEEIGHQRPHLLQTPPPPRLPHDPQLDHFMESYCGVLHRYKEELSRPFHEASFFLSSMQSKLTSLCGNGTFSISSSPPLPDEASGSKEKGMSSCGDAEAGGEGDDECDGSHFAGGEQELRDMLLLKYSGYLSSLRKELMKKKKKNKLPKEARMALLQWWNNHYRWPYPTEEEKLKLSEVTGLDPKQINNWFINQRKRHWKPSEDMRVSLMEGVTGGGIG